MRAGGDIPQALQRQNGIAKGAVSRFMAHKTILPEIARLEMSVGELGCRECGRSSLTIAVYY